MSFWAWLGNNEKQIKLVFGILGALYVLWEYRDREEQTRKERVAKLSAEMHEGAISDATSKLLAFYSSSRFDDWVKTTNPKSYHEELMAKFDDENLTEHVRALLGFYGNVGNCAQFDLCDVPTACNLFFTEVQAFRENYRGFLTKWKNVQADYSVTEVERFAVTSCSGAMKQYCAATPNSPDCKSP